MAEKCNDSCCQIAFCLRCEEVMEPTGYYVGPDNKSVVAVEVTCSKCRQVGVSVDGKILSPKTGKVSKTAVIRALETGTGQEVPA